VDAATTDAVSVVGSRTMTAAGQWVRRLAASARLNPMPSTVCGINQLGV
jgi:hypothetical protein